MTARVAYQYVVLRCVPRADREEFLNVGVVLYCHETDFLGADWAYDPARLLALDPHLDPDRVGEALRFVSAVCAGDATAGAAGTVSTSQRFGFLKAPRSTVVRPGPVHGGLTASPTDQLDRLRAQMVDQDHPHTHPGPPRSGPGEED